MKRLAVAGVSLAMVAAGWLLLRPAADTPTVAAEAVEPASAATSSPRPFVIETTRDPIPSGRVGAGLNAADGTAARDLAILQDVLGAWRRLAKDTGNPVGTNREITAALTGRNPWRLAFLPPDHPAINAGGELCDRWGTPLFFHQLGGDRMELRSSGPDRQRYTDDDIVL